MGKSFKIHRHKSTNQAKTHGNEAKAKRDRHKISTGSKRKKGQIKQGTKNRVHKDLHSFLGCALLKLARTPKFCQGSATGEHTAEDTDSATQEQNTSGKQQDGSFRDGRRNSDNLSDGLSSDGTQIGEQSRHSDFLHF